MADVKIISSNGSKTGNLTQCLTRLLLFCLCLSSLQAFGFQLIKSSNLVFCPLQKAWVKRYNPSVKIEEPLENICSTSERKIAFFIEAVKIHPLQRFASNSAQTEKLFFDYLEKGKQAFAQISPSPNSPERQLAKLAATEKSTGGNYKTDFNKLETEVFTLAQRPRPPTPQKSATFETAAFQKLKKIFRRIQPRAPPAYL